MPKAPLTEHDLIEGLCTALAQLADAAPAVGGQRLDRDAALLLYATPAALAAQWADAPAAYFDNPVVRRVCTKLVAQTHRPELLPVLDAHAVAWELEALTLMPFGPSALRQALATRPVGTWMLSDRPNLSYRGRPLSRLTLAAAWADAPAVEALLAGPDGGVDPQETPDTPEQALLLGAALGVLQAQNLQALDRNLPQLAAWWHRALAQGADPTQPHAATVPLAQNLHEEHPWTARPWGSRGMPATSSADGSARDWRSLRQQPTSPLGVVGQAFHQACCERLRTKPSEGASRTLHALRALMLSHPAGSVELTDRLLPDRYGAWLAKSLRHLPPEPRWDVAAPGPGGWDPVLAILERLPSQPLAAAQGFLAALQRHRTDTGQAWPEPDPERFNRWVAALYEAASGLHARQNPEEWADWLGAHANAPGMGLSSEQAVRWRRWCDALADVLRKAPERGALPEAQKAWELAIALVPAQVEHLRPSRRQRL